jgi:hypothetical protein
MILRQAAAFWTLAALFLMLFFASAAASPLYRVYQAQFHFIVAGWALGGLYLPLGPSLAAQATGSPNPLWGGLVIFLLRGTGAAVGLLLLRPGAS